MGNSLLDFVMALVRDPDAAARYAADPAGALAAAGLPAVTITDVQNLIPVVTESMAAATPTFGAAFDAANVWTSGAAAAAFDAFQVPHPDPDVQQPVPAIEAAPVDAAPPNPSLDQVADQPAFEPVPILDPAGTDAVDHLPSEPIGHDWADENGWASPQSGHAPADHQGFDLF